MISKIYLECAITISSYTILPASLFPRKDIWVNHKNSAENSF